MRHRKKGRKLKRPTPHRLLLLRGLACDLILQGKIKTTVAKAKEIRKYLERVITEGKKFNPQDTSNTQSINAARKVFSLLQNKHATKKLLNEIAQKYKDVNGGYTRIIRAGRRKGDNGETAIITFTEPISEKIKIEKAEAR